MDRIRRIHNRLENWANWQAGGCGVAGGGMFDPNRVGQTADVLAGLRNTDPRFNACALETDGAICSLPDDLKRTVIADYTWDGGKEVIAKKLGVTRATLHRRLCNADRRLDEYFTLRAERAKQIRERNNFASYT